LSVKQVAALKALQQAIDSLSRQITRCAEAPRVAALKDQLPSVGAQTVLTLDVELGDLTRFGNAKQLCASAGLVPRVADAADRQSHGPLTKGENAEVRWIVGQWALCGYELAIPTCKRGPRLGCGGSIPIRSASR